MSSTIFGFLLLGVVILGVNSSTKVVKNLPQHSSSSSLISPKPRIKIPSDFAKNYWVSGTFFNNANFQGLPMSFYFTGPKCVNLHSLKKSLKPLGCVMLYKEKNCGGHYIVASSDMADLGLEGEIHSMRTCPPLDDSWKSISEQREEDGGALYKTVDLGVTESE